MAEESNSLEYTPTWVVAFVSFVIILASLLAERGLHKFGKILKHNRQDALFEALQKLKAELMLLGFISLLLTVTQRPITLICMPSHLATIMLPCKKENETSTETSSHETYFTQVMHFRRHLSSESSDDEHCTQKGKVPLVSVEALHQLHIFIFVLAVVHVIFCATTMVLGGARIRQWKKWEDSIKRESRLEKDPTRHDHEHHHRLFLEKHAKGYWRKAAVISWLMAFFKQFYGSITKSDYIALRRGFIMTHCPSMPDFDFHKYMMRTLEIDFKKIVGISWYLWLFVVVFLLLNVEGWHTYFWMAFLPLVLLLLVGAKLEHIISRLALEVVAKRHDTESAGVEPSDKHFWFGRPDIVLHLIHFILFQNSFEIAFFFWILSTYGFRSCIMEKLGYIVPRLIMGVIVQVLCSYSTLPLYALVSQMGSKFKKGMFDEYVESMLEGWLASRRPSAAGPSGQMHRLATEASKAQNSEQEMVCIEGSPSAAAAVVTQLSSPNQTSTDYHSTHI